MAVKSIEEFLRIGEVVLVQAKPLRGAVCRFRTVIRGWHSSIRIILDRPVFDTGVDPLHEGCACTIRFLHEGTACAFRSSLSNWYTLSDSRSFHVAWPHDFEAVGFRKSPRVSFHIPCTVDISGTASQGVLRDISTAGCGLNISETLDAGLQLGLNFRLPTGTSITGLRTIVRNTRVIQQQTIVGCEFMPEQTVVQNQIANFIDTMLERKNDARTARRRILVIDGNAQTSGELCRRLIDEGYDAYSAATAVDAFARLRVLNPLALLVRVDLNDLPSDKLVRLIKADEAYLTLPVLAFGDDGAAGAEQVIEAGASAYFPLASAVDQLYETVSALCSGTVRPSLVQASRGDIV